MEAVLQATYRNAISNCVKRDIKVQHDIHIVISIQFFGLRNCPGIAWNMMFTKDDVLQLNKNYSTLERVYACHNKL